MASKRLGQQWTRHRRVVQRRGVELEELEVGHGDPGAQRHGDAVAGGLGWVGRHGEELARAARGQHHLGSSNLLEHAVGVEGRDAHAPATLDDEVNGEPLLQHCGRAVAHSRDERPLDLGPGGRPPGVQDASGGVPTFSGQGQIAAGFAVEHRTEGDELVDTTRPFVDEYPHGVDVTQARSRRQGVGQVEVGGVLVTAHRRRDPPLGPARRRLGQVRLGEHTHPEAGRGGQTDHRGQPRHAGAEDQDVEFHEWRPDGPGAGLNPRRPGVARRRAPPDRGPSRRWPRPRGRPWAGNRPTRPTRSRRR